MHEQHHDSPRHQRLISLLQADFTPPDKQALAERRGGSALTRLLAASRAIEDIDERFESDDNIELGEAVERLVAPAPVSPAFKGFITGEIRRAHAWQSKVDSVVSPDRLGLLSGEGIFDPTIAQSLEGRALRGRVADIYRRFMVASDAERRDPDLPLLPRPGVRPRDVVTAVDQVEDWIADYERTYGDEVIEDVGIIDAFRDAAPTATPLEPLGDFIPRLQELRDQAEGDKTDEPS